MPPTDELLISSSTRFTLSTTFAWPFKHEEMNPPKRFYIKVGLIAAVSVLTLCVPVFVNLYYVLENNLDPSENYGLLFAYVGLLPMFIITATNSKKISHLIKDLCDFTDFGKPPGFDKLNKRLDWFSSGLSWYIVAATPIYTYAKMRLIPECKEERQEFQVCGLIVPIWTPWVVDSWFLYAIHAIYTTVYGLMHVRCALFLTIQVLELTLNIKLKIDHLNSMLVKCFDQDANLNKKRLQKCIRYHQAIISYNEKLSRVYFSGTSAHLIGSVIACAGLANQVQKQDMVAFFHFLGWILSIFVTSLAGQILMDSSLSVGDAALSSDWVLATPSLRRDLLLLIMRSQKPFLLKAGFNDLSLELFVAIMKLSYSVLTLIS